MAKKDIGIYLNIGIAAILETLVIFLYPIITKNALILKSIDYFLLLVSLLLLTIAILVYKEKYGRILAYISIGLSIILLISGIAIVPGILALIGSIIMVKRT